METIVLFPRVTDWNFASIIPASNTRIDRNNIRFMIIIQKQLLSYFQYNIMSVCVINVFFWTKPMKTVVPFSTKKICIDYSGLDTRIDLSRQSDSISRQHPSWDCVHWEPSKIWYMKIFSMINSIIHGIVTVVNMLRETSFNFRWMGYVLYSNNYQSPNFYI
jgi:hypothetical protein